LVNARNVSSSSNGNDSIKLHQNEIDKSNGSGTPRRKQRGIRLKMKYYLHLPIKAI
jgi:hypothetical protein